MRHSTAKQPLIMDVNPKSFLAEAYRVIRTNIEFSSRGPKLKTIVITSAHPQEGKSTTAANTAVAFAQAGKQVLLIDANLSKPAIHHIFSKPNRIGLSDILAHSCNVNEMIQETHINRLSIITSGRTPPDPSELLSSDRLTEVLDELKTIYDMIIIDTPPALTVTDAQVIAAKCDGVLLVAHVGKVNRQSVTKVKVNLDHVNARLLGVILNNAKRTKRDKQEVDYNE